MRIDVPHHWILGRCLVHGFVCENFVVSITVVVIPVFKGNAAMPHWILGFLIGLYVFCKKEEKLKLLELSPASVLCCCKWPNH